MAAPYTPTTKTLFNNPQSTSAAAETINDEVDRLIDGTPGGGVGVIRMAAYLFDIDSTADKLIAAYRRGVRVQLLVDDGENSSQLARVQERAGHQPEGEQLRDHLPIGLPPAVAVDHPLEVLPVLPRR